MTSGCEGIRDATLWSPGVALETTPVERTDESKVPDGTLKVNRQKWTSYFSIMKLLYTYQGVCACLHTSGALNPFVKTTPH